jgi:hypothetical protein
MLLGATLCLAPGCLIEEPPDLSAPTPHAPHPLVETAAPPLNAPFQTLSTDRNMTFQVSYLAEDFGDPVIGVLYLNYGSDNEGLLGQNSSSLPVEGSDGREVAVTWVQNLNEPEGCYKVTMAITYVSNTASDRLRSVIIEDAELASFVTWWVAHDIEPQNLSLNECYPPPFTETEDDE